MEIVTKEFTITASALQRVLAVAWFKRWWWALLLPVVGLVGVGFAIGDLRWVILGLMLGMVCFPGVTVLVMFDRMLRATTGDVLKRKRVRIEKGVRVSVEMIGEEGEVREKKDYEWERIKSFVRSGNYYVITFKGDDAMLLIPVEATL